MILTSKRCYLNVLTQLLDKDTLLKASYYIADADGLLGNNHVEDSDTLKYDENGNLINYQTYQNAVQQYNIVYGDGSFNPTVYITSQSISYDNAYRSGSVNDPEKRFIASLMNTDTKMKIYEDLFRSQLRGNGLQIFVYIDEYTVRNFAWITCEYLADVFGCDVTFIDPAYRPNIVKGKTFYQGNKQRGYEEICKLRDLDAIDRITTALTTSGIGNSMNNLSEYLRTLTIPELIKVYNLMWPNDWLPPNNYTADHLKEIIIGKLMDEKSTIMKNTPMADEDEDNPYSNLYSDTSFYDMLDDYD